MKLKVKAEDLYSAIKSASELMKEKKSCPIFGYYLFHAEDDVLQITSAHDDGACVTIPIHAEKDLLESYSFCVPQKIKEIAAIVDGDITIEYEASSNMMAISYATGNTELVCMSAETFIKKEFVAKSGAFTSMAISSAYLKEGLSFCAPFTSDSPIRPVMNSVHLDINEKGITFVGTDAACLAVYNVQENGLPESSCNLTNRYATMLTNLLGNSETVNLRLNENTIEFSNGNFAFLFPVVIGNYPNYKKVIPTKEDLKSSTTLKKADITHSTTMVGICTSKSTKLVKMVVSGESMALYGEDIDNGSKASGYSTCANAEFSIGLNIDKLATALHSINAESINIGFMDSNKPVILTPSEDDSHTILLMPVSI